MPHETLKTMRALREDMRQRLLNVPEYRTLVALDRSIEELCGIMQDALALVEAPARETEMAPAPQAQIETPQPATAAARQNAIASAFAETLAAKMDHRQGARTNGYPQAQRALGG